MTITLVTPFLVYLAADRLGASGVLAAAAGGMYLSRKGGGMYTPQARLVGRSVWNTLFFVFNGALFIILGLQLREIFNELAIFPAVTLAQYAAAIAGTVIAVRLVWVFAGWVLRRSTPAAWAFVLGWSGMRGIISLAAALSIPDNVAGGAPFPARDLILFITFAGDPRHAARPRLEPALVRARPRGRRCRRRRSAARPGERARRRGGALGRLVELDAAAFVSAAHWEVAGRLRSRYEEQLAHFSARIDGSPGSDAVQHDLERELVRHTIDAERAALDDMRHAGEIGDEVFRRLQYEIDLAESRLLVD